MHTALDILFIFLIKIYQDQTRQNSPIIENSKPLKGNQVAITERPIVLKIVEDIAVPQAAQP